MTRSISEKIDRTLLFQGCHGQFLGSIKRPGLDIWKKSLLNDKYFLFSNSRSLKRPGLIIESLEYILNREKMHSLLTFQITRKIMRIWGLVEVVFLLMMKIVSAKPRIHQISKVQQKPPIILLIITMLKVAFIQKVLLIFSSHPQKDEPNYFPKIKF